ncbi:MAG: hypothetical protein LUE20_02905 [Oscillospiraceae bacterium]|nr:hypothetical protein [Oscillospiraceae bacterium]
MKKVLSIVLAIVMVLSVSVVAFADDEVIWGPEEHVFFNSSSWATQEIDDPEGFLEALQVEGAVLVITRDTEVHIQYTENTEEADGTYENFCFIDSWYSTGDERCWLGTAGHSSSDEPDKGIIDCLSDDGITVTYDANAVYARYEEMGALSGGTITLVINTSETNAYKVSSISVILPETTEETSEDDSSSETAEASEDATETSTESSSSSSSSSSPDTGVALALVPMAIAGIAVVSSKRR